MDPLTLAIVVGLMALAALVGAVHVRRRRSRQTRDEAELEARRARGAHLARSLHPVIDPDVCIGSLSCLRACPEGDILGVVDGAARLVHGDHCIGHGRCAAECPVGAVKLVFGSAERGVDLPEVDAFFESSRPGVHIVGELGGMGLIKNAMTQGLQVAERIAYVGPRNGGPVVIVGAGPAGIAAAVGLKSRNVPFRVLEQGSVGGTVFHYPRRKVAMTEVVELPGYGKFGKPTISKEELLTTWSKVLDRTGIRIEQGVKVNAIQGEPGNFVVETDKGGVQASRVVLAVGRRGTPRKLGVKGEEMPKVVYGLTEPEQYAGAKVLVVGGGDAALEAAIQLADESDAQVALSYRGAELGKCREANRAKITALAEKKRVRMMLPSVVKEVRQKDVVMDAGGKEVALPNDFVIVNIGGELPLEFLGKAGISLRRYHGQVPGEVRAKSGRDEATRIGEKARQSRTDKEKRTSRLVHDVYIMVGLAILGYLAWVGRDYYTLSHEARRASALHPLLKPAGPWGHGVGIVATAFMMSNFLYAARKRWKSLSRLGSVVRWLDFHVFVGFMSPLVIAFHAAFQSNNMLATGTAGALTIVVSTGIVGRFIYGWVPAAGGKQLELEELTGHFERLKQDVSALPTLLAKSIADRVTRPVKAGSLLLVFIGVPFEAIALRMRLLWLRLHFRDRARYRAFKAAVMEAETIRWQIRFYSSLKRLLRGWRVFHASLAVLLVLVIAAHIGLSLYLGYGLRFFR